MRLLPILFLLTALLLPAQMADEEAVVTAIQRVFVGISAHDGEMIRSSMLPDARIYLVRDAAAPTNVPLADLINSIVTNKSPMIERFTNSPQVLVRGRIAQLWGEYEFLREGKFSHCGVDTATLFKTENGWKVATLSYTAETKGCPGQ